MRKGKAALHVGIQKQRKQKLFLKEKVVLWREGIVFIVLNLFRRSSSSLERTVSQEDGSS